MATHLALFRGINVGGKNIIPMSSLSEMFERCGCEDVRTFIQSGNVYFKADKAVATDLPDLILKHTLKKFNYAVPVILRTTAQLAKVIANNPYPSDSDIDRLNVFFLASKPSATDKRSLDPLRSPNDTYIVNGQEIYACLGKGMANTKLTSAYFDSKLHTICTARNWRTTTRLLELMTGL